MAPTHPRIPPKSSLPERHGPSPRVSPARIVPYCLYSMRAQGTYGQRKLSCRATKSSKCWSSFEQPLPRVLEHPVGSIARTGAHHRSPLRAMHLPPLFEPLPTFLVVWLLATTWAGTRRRGRSFVTVGQCMYPLCERYVCCTHICSSYG